MYGSDEDVNFPADVRKSDALQLVLNPSCTHMIHCSKQKFYKTLSERNLCCKTTEPSQNSFSFQVKFINENMFSNKKQNTQKATCASPYRTEGLCLSGRLALQDSLHRCRKEERTLRSQMDACCLVSCVKNDRHLLFNLIMELKPRTSGNF